MNTVLAQPVFALGDSLGSTASLFDTLGQALTAGLDAAHGLVDSLERSAPTATDSIRGAGAAESPQVGTLVWQGPAWDEAEKAIAQGREFFSLLNGMSPLMRDSLQFAKQTLSTIGATVAPSAASSGRAADASDETPAEPQSNTNAVDIASALHTSITSIWNQGSELATTLETAYETGSQGLEQAQSAAGFFQNAWNVAARELNQGQSFFSVLRSVSPLIGEGFTQARQSYETLSEAVQLGAQGMEQARGLASTLGRLFSSPDSTATPSRVRGLTPARGARRLLSKGAQISIKGGRGIGKLMGTLGSLARTAIPAVITGVRALGVALMSNPIGLIIGGIALAAGLIIRFWEPIKAFFSGLWDGIKTVFASTWGWLKGLFLNFHPLGLIVKHWEPITEFFGALWDRIKAIFAQAWEWLKESLVAPLADIGKTVGSWFGSLFGGGEQDDVAAPVVGSSVSRTPDATADSSGRALIGQSYRDNHVSAEAATSGSVASTSSPRPQSTVTNHYSYSITVHPAPGMDERQLATLVRQELEKRDRRTAAGQRRAMYDGA